jgi:ethanolamine utilization protein EutN
MGGLDKSRRSFLSRADNDGRAYPCLTIDTNERPTGAITTFSGSIPMDLGRVVGTVVSTMKAPGLHSYKLMLVSSLDAQLTDNPTTDSDIYVAVDLIGAGEGEVVLVCRGSAARVVTDTSGVPTDAAIIAVIDTIRLGASTAYSKG